MKRPMMECPECDGKGEVVHPGLGLPYTTTCKFCGGLEKCGPQIDLARTNYQAQSTAKYGKLDDIMRAGQG